jgi:hypothetical protein
MGNWKRALIIGLLPILVSTSCKDASTKMAPHARSTVPTTSEKVAFLTPSPTPAEFSESYPGVKLEYEFPVLFERPWDLETANSGITDIDVGEALVQFHGFRPVRINNDGRSIPIKTNEPDDSGYYHSNFGGVARLLGPKTKQIYVEAYGPAGSCCSNFWIVDLTGPVPGNVFRSEDYGEFREGMEIEDVDGDGIYELFMFDNCFRYFAGDCGSCSPQPRVAFKYNVAKRAYLPIKNLQQSFIRSNMKVSEEWFAAKFDKLRTDPEHRDETGVRRSTYSYVVDLLHIGQEEEAWRFLQKYAANTPKEDLKEMKSRLRSCKYYQALRRLR